MHDSLARGMSQMSPHERQFTSVPRDVSQPSALVASQSAKPALHAPMAHAPVAQDADAFASMHGARHAPQSVSVRIDVSQPVAVMPSQSCRPGSHAPSVQRPPGHAYIAPASEQATRQAPQSVTRSSGVSHPSAAKPLQSPKPGSHAVIVHVPPVHAADAFAGAHGRAHPPQSARLVAVSTHAVPQSVCVPVHTLRHANVVPLGPQSGVPPLHVDPQAPQFVAVARLVSQPLAASMSQSRQPASHVVTTQLPVAQLSLAWASAQVTPHAPQSFEVSRRVSHPSAAMPLQSPKPASHAPTPQRPAVHDAVPCGTLGHASPHAAQSVAVPRARSHPSVARALQSA